MTSRVFLRRLLVATTSLGVALLVCEGALRVAGYASEPARFYDPAVGFRFHPNQTRTMLHSGRAVGEVRINSIGFRGLEPLPSKQERGLRIACVGDSWTFGWSVDEGEAFPSRLAELLAQHGAEVLNCGIPGFNADNELRAYRELIRPLNPDVVVIGVVTNDLEPTFPAPATFGDPFERSLGRTALHEAYRSHLARRGQSHTPGSAEHLALERAFHAHQRAILTDPACPEARPFVPVWRASFEALVAEARADGCRILVLGFPARFQVNRLRGNLAQERDPEPVLEQVGGWQRLLRSICAEHQVSYLDFLPAFAAAKIDPYGEVDRGHPGTQGHDLIASGVARALEDSGWLEGDAVPQAAE